MAIDEPQPGTDATPPTSLEVGMIEVSLTVMVRVEIAQ